MPLRCAKRSTNGFNSFFIGILSTYSHIVHPTSLNGHLYSEFDVPNNSKGWFWVAALLGERAWWWWGLTVSVVAPASAKLQCVCLPHPAVESRSYPGQACSCIWVLLFCQPGPVAFADCYTLNPIQADTSFSLAWWLPYSSSLWQWVLAGSQMGAWSCGHMHTMVKPIDAPLGCAVGGGVRRERREEKPPFLLCRSWVRFGSEFFQGSAENVTSQGTSPSSRSGSLVCFCSFLSSSLLAFITILMNYLCGCLSSVPLSWLQTLGGQRLLRTDAHPVYFCILMYEPWNIVGPQ